MPSPNIFVTTEEVGQDKADGGAGLRKVLQNKVKRPFCGVVTGLDLQNFSREFMTVHN